MAIAYRQNDPNWASHPYAGENMAAAGCGPTAVAIVLEKSPVEIADWMTAHGYASNGSGTYQSGITACIKAYGYSCAQLTGSSMAGITSASVFETWKNSVKSGNMAVLLMGGLKTGCINSYWSTAGHYISITKYDASTDKYYVIDPAWDARDGWHPWSDFAGCIKHCYVTNIKYSKTTGSGKITVDGDWGVNTTKKAQKVFKTTVDGIISNQNKNMKPYLQNCYTSSWEFVDSKKLKNGSALIKAIQKKLGVTVDGFCGMKTIKALQKFLGVKVDGYFGPTSVKAWQTWLNKQ